MNTPEHNAENALKDAYAFIDGMDPDAEAYANALANIRELEAICAKHRDETRRCLLYTSPAMQPIFDEIEQRVLKVVNSV